jgi:Ca-activated chloride channel homolog
LPNLYHGMPLRLYGRYRTGGPAKVRVQAEINGAAFDQKVDVNLPAHEEANPEIERMWAWQKIDRLLKEADSSGSRTPVVDEIVRLGEAYSIVTEYTSFIVLENEGEYRRWSIDRRNLLRVAGDRQQREMLEADLARIRERSLANLGPHLSDENRLASAESTGVKSQADPAQAQPGQAQPGQPGMSPASPGARDLDFHPGYSGGGGGHGAFDPISGTIVLALAGLGFAARRPRSSSKRRTGTGE